jgi:purine-nucleoside phosphorylase
MKGISEKITAAETYIQKRIRNFKPTVGLILGSGLGNLADEIKSPVKIKYNDIPGFPFSSVQGHAGQLVIGTLQGKKVIAMQGRAHYYEGNSLEEVTLPIRVMKKLGVENVIITNAAGGVNRKFTPGDLMIITDHINFSGVNPLRGKNQDEFGERFPDLSTCYDHELMKLVRNVGKEKKIKLQEGVYFFSVGPSYETPAEIRAIQILGASAVGMSTVPEVVVAAHCGLKVIGISCITNMAAGILNQKLAHEEVIEITVKVNQKFITLLKAIVKKL